MARSPGDILDRRYRLRRLIARSEDAELFEAAHVHLPRTVAVRVLDRGASERLRGKLVREAELLERARHRSILSVLDVAETPEGEPYLVTEALTGRPLDGVLAVRGTLPADEAIPVALDLADALAHAHSLGIAHAGLAPSSVLLGTSGGQRASAPPGGAPSVAKLLDLGEAPSPSGAFGGPLAAMGYASPERLAGGDAEAANDVHALGALLHELLTGELPRGSSDTLPAPPAVVEVVRHALAPRAVRYPSALELAAALRDALASEELPRSLPPPSRREHVRAGYVTPVRLRRPNGEAIDGRTEDISEGGLLVLTAADVAPEESVLVRFALPRSGRMVSVPALVRWAREGRGAARAIGLAFVEPGEKVLEDVRAYVAFLGA